MVPLPGRSLSRRSTSTLVLCRLAISHRESPGLILMTDGAPATRTAASVIRMARVREAGARRGVIPVPGVGGTGKSPRLGTVGHWGPCDKSDGSYERMTITTRHRCDTPY